MKISVSALVLIIVGLNSAQAQEAGKKTYEDCTYTNVTAILEDGKLLERTEYVNRSRFEKTKHNGAAADKFVIEYSGDVESENFTINEDGSKTKDGEMQFSTIGRIDREKRDLGANRFYQFDAKKAVHTAKGDFNFRLPGGVVSKTKEINSTFEMVAFDNGVTSKVEYMKFNGKLSEDVGGEYEESEYQDGEYTVYSSRLKAPYSYDDLKTVIESDVSVCRRKNLN